MKIIDVSENLFIIKPASQGVAQLGRAPHLGCGCRMFESCHPDNLLNNPLRVF